MIPAELEQSTRMEEYPYVDPVGVSRYRSRNSNPEEIFLQFSPNLSLQRYYAVATCLNRIAGEEDIEVVTEFGPCYFHFLYRAMETTQWLKKINLVDIDSSALSEGCRLLNSDRYNRTERGRVKPLTAYVYKGNIADVDHRVSDADVVVGIELIEHMVSCDLEKFPAHVFGFIQPKYAIFTTPNSDFNILFNFKKNQFRHHDHKFEFSRLEFREWAQKIVQHYPSYNFNIYGIGAPPPEDSNLDVGFATQMVIFKRNYDPVPIPTELAEPYKLMDVITLNKGDNRTDEQKLFSKIGQIGTSLIGDLALDSEYSIFMRQERCQCKYMDHWMDVVPAQMIAKHLQCRDIVTDAQTVVRAITEIDLIRYDVEMTIALGPVFIYSCDCLMQYHDVPFDFNPDVAPSPSFYALPSINLDDDTKCQLQDDVTDEQLDLKIYLYTEQFLDSVVEAELAARGRREACELGHHMKFATPEMVAAHLKSKDIETNAVEVLRCWNKLASAKYPIEETTFGYIFVVEKFCGETPCVFNANDEPNDEPNDEYLSD